MTTTRAMHQNIRRFSLLARCLFAAPLLGLAGCDVRLGKVEYLWLLWLVPLVAAFYIYAFRQKTILMRRFASPEMLVRIAGGVSRSRQVFKVALLIAALALGLLSLTEVKYGFTWEEVKREGVDIVIALDVSDSMLVQDVEADGRLNRLQRAKREILDLLQLLEGDRVGLVAFSGVAFVECPLTLDYAAAEIFLEDIDTELIPIKGTAIDDALRVSLKAFEGSSHDSRAIILITDGEDHSGSVLAVAEQAKQQNVRIFPIGIGRKEGAPIPAPGGGFRKDRRGEMILSKLDEKTLQKIALATGGAYAHSVTGDMDLDQIYSKGIKATLEDHELGSRRRQRWEQRFQWILVLVLLLLAVEPFIRGRARARPATGSAMLLLMASLLSPTIANAQQTPTPVPQPLPPPVASAIEATPPAQIDDPYAAYDSGAYDQALQSFVDQQVEHPQNAALMLNIGSAHYRMKNYEEAVKSYGAAAMSGNHALRAEAFYNLGNVAFRQGKLEEAIGHYQAALEIAPDDEDSKFNLEFARDEIRRRHEEAKKRQEQQQQQGDQQEQNNEQQGKQQQQGDQQQQEGPQKPQPGQDTDGDGLQDQLEKSADNPTDPHNPDSDGDGLLDGQEDMNHNGKVDEEETDPNKKDSDGDGEQDSAQAAQAESKPAEEGLSKEEAERYLRALEEGKPKDRRRKTQGRRSRPAKDW